MANLERTVYGSALEPAIFGEYQIKEDHGVRQLQDDPELVVRRDGSSFYCGDDAEIPRNEASVLAHYQSLGQTVRLLHDNYGLHSANMVVAFEQVGPDGKQAYLGMSKIHGSYFRLEHLSTEAVVMPYQLGEVPQDVTIAAFDGLVRYYEDVASDTVGDFIGDLRLGNLVYGRQRGDHEDHVYMMDFHYTSFMKKRIDGYKGITQSIQPGIHGGGFKLLDDLAEMRRQYGEEFTDFQERLDRVQVVAAAKHEAWVHASRASTGTSRVMRRTRI